MPKKIIVVFVIFGLLLLHILLIEPHLKTTTEKIRSKNLVISFPENSLEEITFRDITLVKSSGEYRVKAPFSHPASKEVCETLFLQCEKITARDTLSNWKDQGKTLVDYGLDSPRIRLLLKNQTGQRILLIGNPVEGEQQEECYAMLPEQEEIFILKESLARDLSKKVMEYSDSRPFEFIQKEPVKISWFRGDEFTFLLYDKHRFLVGNREKIWQARYKFGHAFITVMGQMSFLESPYSQKTDQETGLDSPWSVVEVLRSGNRKKYLLIGEKIEGKEERWIKLEKDGLAFQYPSAILDLFLADFKRLAGNTLFEGSVTSLKKVNFEFHDSKTEMLFLGNKTRWELVHPDSWIFDSGKILNFILKFSIREIEDLENRRLETPKVTVSFQYEESDSADEIIRLYSDPASSKTCFAELENIPTSAKIEGNFLSEISDDPSQFVSKNLFEICLRKAFKMVLTAPSKTVAYKKNTLEQWVSLESSVPESQAPSPSWISALQNTQCFSAMKRKNGVDFGFEEPFLVMEFFDLEGRNFFTARIGSYSSPNETFILGNQSLFLFFKKFPEIKI